VRYSPLFGSLRDSKFMDRMAFGLAPPKQEGAVVPGTSSVAGGGGAGGGMSRAAKKRLKKKQKEQKKKRNLSSKDDGSDHHGVRAAATSTAASSSSRSEKKRHKKKHHFPVHGSNDAGDEESNCDSHTSSGGRTFDDNQQMEIADISRGELEYLSSQGVNVAKAKKSDNSDKKKKSKKHKSKDVLELGDASLSDEDEKSESDGDDAEDDEKEEREILHTLSQSLTPSQVLFSGQIMEHEDSVERCKGELGEEGDTGSEIMRLQDSASDPCRIVQDLTSTSRARVVFESLLAPSGVTAEEFYRDYWEKKPLLISKPKVTFKDDGKDSDAPFAAGAGAAISPSKPLEHRARLHNILSKEDIESMLAKCSLRYGREINVTRYADAGDGSGTKRRLTLDLPPKRIKRRGGSASDGDEEEEFQHVVADPKDVWTNFSNGCTVRLLCPHLHSDSTHSLLSSLELEFGCFVGSNAYLTPGGDAQGFAPHYDDIEAFVLQLEGRKRWKVYPPPNRAETLPRFSSRDYTEKDMEGTHPVIDTVLGPGDVLYMPRGWIHQAHTPQESSGEDQNGHSLHLTASAMQKWSWTDLLELVMPEALESVAASETSTSLREGLPRNFLCYMGAMYDTMSEEAPEGLKQAISKADETSEGDRNEIVRQRTIKRMQNRFCHEANKRIMRVCKEAMTMVNAGCDQIGKRFLSDRQPPALTPNEAVLTSEHRSENGGKIWPNTMCRLVRPGIARLVLEDGKAVVYHCMDNSRMYHGAALSPLEFEVDDAPALEMLLTTTEPHWVCVRDLIHGDVEDKMEIAQSLYDEGILAIFQADRPDKTVQTG